jgi:Zn-finger nucleic acid-binding protein
VEQLAADRVTGLTCPLCPDTRLVHVNFISFSDIVMDFCPQCQGLWLDRGELDAITAEVRRLEQVPESWDHRVMVFLANLPF